MEGTSWWWGLANGWKHDVEELLLRTCGYVATSFKLKGLDEDKKNLFFKKFADVVTSEIIQGINVVDVKGEKRYVMSAIGERKLGDGDIQVTDNISSALKSSGIDDKGCPAYNTSFWTYAIVNDANIEQAKNLRIKHGLDVQIDKSSSKK